MANLKSKDIKRLSDWNTKELRKLRMTLKNRIAALEVNPEKELAPPNPLAALTLGECRVLLEDVVKAEKGLKFS